MEGKEYHFENTATLGRIEECEVTIIDPGISREHARVTGRRGVFIVEDLGSSNGTRLNGETINGPEVLRDGDYITVGAVNIMFSNLEMDKAGEPTEKMHLSEKQADKLDHSREFDLGNLPTLKEFFTPLRIIVTALFLFMLGFLPILTRRFLELGVALLLLACIGGLVVVKLRNVLSLILRKTSVFAGVLFGIVFIAAGTGKLFPSAVEAQEQQEWSEHPIDYAEYEQSGGYDNWALGYQEVSRYYGDVNYRDKIIFRYYKSPQRQRITLEYAACGISEGEAAIFLNDKKLDYIPVAETCRYDLSIVLPPEKLKTGENYVVFDNLRNDRNGTETWLISYVKFREEAIPKADPVQAEQNFRLGMRLYDDRQVDPRNRQRAITHFRLARDYLEMIEKKPHLYGEATRMIRTIDKQLQRIFQNGMFEAQRQTNFGKYEEAANILRKTMSYFDADKKDPRFLQLQSALNQLSG